MDKDELSMMNECYHCIFKRSVPGDAHIACNNPDSEMTGDTRGIKNGWFMYPALFDPVWKTKKCLNFENKVNPTVSPCS